MSHKYPEDGQIILPQLQRDVDGDPIEKDVPEASGWPTITDREYDALVADVRLLILRRFGVDYDGDSPIGFSIHRRKRVIVQSVATIQTWDMKGDDEEAAEEESLRRIGRGIESLAEQQNIIFNNRASRRHLARIKAEREEKARNVKACGWGCTCGFRWSTDTADEPAAKKCPRCKAINTESHPDTIRVVTREGVANFIRRQG